MEQKQWAGLAGFEKSAFEDVYPPVPGITFDVTVEVNYDNAVISNDTAWRQSLILETDAAQELTKYESVKDTYVSSNTEVIEKGTPGEGELFVNPTVRCVYAPNI